MKPWGRFAFILFAFGMALLHTAVPHHHAKAGKGDLVFVHACGGAHAAGGGLLQRALSTDLGVGHLETFKKGTDTRIQISSRFVVDVDLFVPLHTTDTHLSLSDDGVAFVEKFHKRLLLFSVSSLRAPPARVLS